MPWRPGLLRARENSPSCSRSSSNTFTAARRATSGPFRPRCCPESCASRGRTHGNRRTNWSRWGCSRCAAAPAGATSPLRRQGQALCHFAASPVARPTPAARYAASSASCRRLRQNSLLLPTLCGCGVRAAKGARPKAGVSMLKRAGLLRCCSGCAGRPGGHERRARQDASGRRGSAAAGSGHRLRSTAMRRLTTQSPTGRGRNSTVTPRLPSPGRPARSWGLPCGAGRSMMGSCWTQRHLPPLR